ncbi:hypothetical protein QEJ31_11505 [Pigmentibacter sp. JX0631]|uniref:hypothetical protein n=1 Tax=Pigmentibacter sp. JX0631 TaxID=2976982 RepID=UPI002468D66A|nr:hypothetical protein [Pigmentibacter sp. JX0631]WGL59147.1 hypothetical protein QEJ31_11505 [Pigmentibacter sp. JX0631]
MNQKHKIEKFIIFLNGSNSHTNVKVFANKQNSSSLTNLNVNEIYIADGGLNHFLRNKISCNKIIWAGDYDSLTEKSKKFLDKNSVRNNMKQERELIVEEISLQKNKDYNDFSFLLELIKKKSKNIPIFIEIFFGLGGRKDHEIANIFEAKRFIKNHVPGGICYFHEGVIISSVNFEVICANKLTFSIFSDEDNASISIKGAKYSGNIILERPSHGLSNSTKGSRILIKPNSSTVLFYF